jgi:hypothetical protein
VSETVHPSAVAAAPPAATLAVEGGDPVAGQLGSYTWNGNGSDSPWLPGTPITVGVGERLAVSLDPDVGVAMWSARRVAAGTSDGAGAVGLGDDAPPVAFAAPAAGHWSVQLTVGFAGEVGSATYYWDVTVR